MSLAVAAEPTPLRVDDHGVVRMGDTRISFDSIVHRHKQGDAPEEIHEGFPGVPLADIYAAISYYLRHREQVEEYLAERRAEAERIRRKTESDPDNEALREKLLAHREQHGWAQGVIRLASDQDFDARIILGLRRRLPELDVVSVRDAGLATASDPEVLEWAAGEQRVLLSHDVSTMVGFAVERVRRGEHHAGLVKVPQVLPIGRAIEELVLIVEAASAEDLRDRTLHLPL